MKKNFIYKRGKFCFEKTGFTTLYNPFFIDKLCSIPDRIKDKSKSQMDEYWGAIRLFLEFLKAEQPQLFQTLSASSLSRDDFGDAVEWEVSLQRFRGYVDIKKKSVSRKNSTISGIHWWIDQLAEVNAIPVIEHTRGFKKDSSVKSKTIIDTQLPDGLFDEIKRLDNSTVLSDIENVYKHIQLESISVEEVPDGFHALSVSAKAEWVLTRRLGRVRAHIEKSIKTAISKRVDGINRIRKSRHLIDVIDGYLNFNGGKGSKNPYRKDLLDLSFDEYRSGLLAWFIRKNEGIQLKDQDGKKYRSAGNILKELRNKEGLTGKEYSWSDDWFAERIGCVPSLYVPCYLLLIFDNYMNVSSAEQIKVNALTAKHDGVQTVRWYKNRAHNWLLKTVSDEPEITTVDVFKILKRATKYYREQCLPEQKGFLILSYRASKRPDEDFMRPLNPDTVTFRNHSKSFFSEITDDEWYVSPDMMRSSLLLLSGFTGGVEEIKEDAQHSSTRVSTIYHDKAAAIAGFSEETREFKEWLQVLVTMNIKDAPLKLGVDPDKYEERLQQILESRFGGLLCKDPRAGVQEGTQKGQVCNKIARCVLCKNKNNLFVESVENITHLLMWQEALKKGIESKVICPETNVNWFFWMRFIDEMLARLESNKLAKKRNEALISAAQESAEGQQNPYLTIDFREVA
ncbi:MULTISPECIES: hypothetical protein [Vibrio harveyi group]|uniref:hypothetical protein n=1 Tax=Vibrio harveyi group TaxID=717610 RepID=UPI0015F5A2DE|nr:MULTISPECIES: hypothetical protein [Vibrio harveyi group]MDF4635217.1 hypothetical protein [Vibrio parahaemolyticus]MDG2619284.1 hypothetical protein [Vibrio parahaemolyticus]MDV5036898.1 hypothetical protein [Vibrio diabolicus]MDV5060224.1 hypothetical protein [Vibrio diabolicus]HBH7879290.1 hypothetical protein [Vibrio parahaemolyticus]